MNTTPTPTTFSDFEPLVLLTMLRGLLAMRGWDPIDLRRLSLREAMVEVGSRDWYFVPMVKDLRSFGLDLREAKQLYESIREVADADAVLTLIAEPDGRVLPHPLPEHIR